MLFRSIAASIAVALADRGKRVLLTGFGKFYPQIHAGHRVQFTDGKDGAKEIGPYPVLVLAGLPGSAKSKAARLLP